MKKIAISLLLTFSGFFSYGQTAASELDLITKAYRNITNFSVGLEMKLYEGQSKIASEQYSGNIKIGQGLYFSSLDEMTVLKNKKVSLMIDHSEKVILVSQPDKKKSKDYFTYELDSAVIAYKVLRLDKLSGNTGKLYLEPKVGKYKTVTVEYDLTTHFIQKLVLTLDEKEADQGKARIEITYANPSTKAIPASDFSESKYIKLSKGKCTPSSAFSTYRIVNQLN